MPPKIERQDHQQPQPPADSAVVQIDSSDDEAETAPVTKTTPPPPQQQLSSPCPIVPSPSEYQTLEDSYSRSFWKAGSYSAGPTSWAPPPPGQLEHARVHPKFLHSNATSHKWAFGAIAELLDNAVDEIHNGATFVKVDKIDITKDNTPALLIQDDGGGMSPEGIRKCMSLGYSSKKTNTTIGQYGNGFKTSTMRLGADVIVFSRATQNGQATQSVGLLSYTFLRRTGQDDVIVPMIDFDISGHWTEPVVYGSQDDWSANLKTILEWSPFTSKDELMHQFDDIGQHGTKIIIFNLWLNDEGIYELSFDDDEEDIRLRDETSCGSTKKLNKRVTELHSHVSYQIRYSLRAYASILYLRKLKNFSIILRGRPVEQFNIVDDLKYQKMVTYKPQVAIPSNEVIVEATLGFIKEFPPLNVSGFNVYHKNRLIRPFWKVTGDGSSRGNGVVGVLEANFIEPAHDKQDFERSSLFVRLETKLKQIVMDYWKCHCHLVGYQPLDAKVRNMQKKYCIQPDVESNTQQEACMAQSVISLPSQPYQTNLGLTNVSADEATMPNTLGSKSIEEICEENIQLFTRCEEHKEKQSNLKQTIEKLEKELEETKSKCAKLHEYLENKKKQKVLKQASGLVK